MIEIELENGYMKCVICKGYIDAGDLTPICECINSEED